MLQGASFLPSGASSILPKISKRVQMVTKFILTVSRKAVKAVEFPEKANHFGTEW